MHDLNGEGAAPVTEVGSHFVANYPPFSVWTPEAVTTEALPALHLALKSGELAADAIHAGLHAALDEFSKRASRSEIAATTA